MFFSCVPFCSVAFANAHDFGTCRRIDAVLMIRCCVVGCMTRLWRASVGALFCATQEVVVSCFPPVCNVADPCWKVSIYHWLPGGEGLTPFKKPRMLAGMFRLPWRLVRNSTSNKLVSRMRAVVMEHGMMFSCVLL